MPKFTSKITLGNVAQTLAKQLRKTKKNAINKGTADLVGRTIISMMKGFISEGRSPIAGHGKFLAYRPSYKKTRKKFGRPTSPPDLNLTGAFLRNLRHRVLKRSNADGFVTTVGFRDRTSQKKEQGHREEHNNQRFRPIIPNEDERYRRDINQKIQEIYIKRLNKLLSKL